MGTMNRILILIGITTLVFICACMYFAWHERIVPDSLIYSYFGAIGAEGIVMGWIKNAKCKMQNAKLNEGDENNGNDNK